MIVLRSLQRVKTNKSKFQLHIQHSNRAFGTSDRRAAISIQGAVQQIITVYCKQSCPNVPAYFEPAPPGAALWPVRHVLSISVYFDHEPDITHVSDFDNGRIGAYRDCGLSYLSIVPHVGRDPMTVSKIWNRWVQDGNTERRAGSTSTYHKQPSMVLMDRAATSRALSQELESFARQQVSARKVR
ncbi:HTH_Tnp_Tc3_2 domain-containing protein [Trichonephila clavipes]|uniref:HTH_Tnp_Tc3_2 domain-containing protein n=1 Tax=Trichonephila clavipes TaxID=2585209 RepID=A0A8X6VYY7_TRICX|nr:HTH_Tnp_Tc3_2 domain-containing protein [Trichonephila clavipes]